MYRTLNKTQAMHHKNLTILITSESKQNDQNAKYLIEKDKLITMIEISENNNQMISEEKLTKEIILQCSTQVMLEEKKKYEKVISNFF